MLRSERHHRENAVNKVVRHGLVEQVRHGVGKDAARFLPAERMLQALGMAAHIGELALLAVRARKHPLGIAVLAQQPAETLEHPVIGFHVSSVHSILVGIGHHALFLFLKLWPETNNLGRPLESYA